MIIITFSEGSTINNADMVSYNMSLVKSADYIAITKPGGY